MPSNRQPSRLSLGYLFSRHAGAVFLLAALGLAGGVLWRSFFQPAVYYSRIDLGCVVTPPAARLDWQAKGKEWRGLLGQERHRRLLGVNLRYAVKHAATRGIQFDTARLRDELALFSPGRVFTVALFDTAADRFGPVVEPTLRDIAINLDFQSLAAIVSDLDPPAAAASWDFSFFPVWAAGGSRSGVIVRPGPDDPYFRVFYHLHALLNEGEALSPEEAWRSAVNHLVDRFGREIEFAGGGGFGHVAARELLREFAAIPVLAANNLYGASGWNGGDGDFTEQEAVWDRRWREDVRVELVGETADSGFAVLEMGMPLYLLSLPRDTVFTRLPPATLAVLAAYLGAIEEDRYESALAARPAPPPEKAVETTPAPVPEPIAAPDRDPPRERDDYERRRAEILDLETALDKAVRERDGILRRLDADRGSEKTLAMEIIAARARADRLKERYDAAVQTAPAEPEPSVTIEAARLMLIRDALSERLAVLLQKCTDQHPIVRQIRRELAAVESLLARQPVPALPVESDDPRTRFRGLEIEWRTALAATEALEQDRRRRAKEIAEADVAVAGLEQRLTELRGRIARLRDLQGGRLRAPVPAARPAEAARPPQVNDAPREPSPPSPPAADPTRLRMPPPPDHIGMRRISPSWAAPLVGVLLGTLLGVLWMLIRELLPGKFADAGEAARILPYPVLAALPAFDPASFRKAAKALSGEIAEARSRRLTFIPSPVEVVEPSAPARRAKIIRAKRGTRLLPWFAGFALVAFAVAFHLVARSGLFNPRASFEGEMTLPAEFFRRPDSFRHAERENLP